MNRFRTVSAILLALALAAVVPVAAHAEADCSYTVSFSRTSSGDVRITGTASCGAPVHQTFLSVSSPTFQWVSDYGTVVSTVVEDSEGNQQYCASVTATYWETFLTLDDESGSGCATF